NLTVNLGAAYDICKVVMNWGSDYATSFSVQGSTDGTTFTTLFTFSRNTSTTNIVTLPNPSYSYIRMQGITRSSTTSGYVVDELSVFGQLTNTCTKPSGLAATNITENTATFGWTAVTGAANYTLQYKTSIVSSWITRTTSSTSMSISALTCNTGYTFMVTANCGSGSSAAATGTFTTSTCTASCGPLLTRYFSADIGDIGIAGSSCLSNGIYTIQGSGSDIGGTDDQFQYAFTNLTGDEHVYAEVLTQDAASSLDKAGLMFRDSVSNTSRFIFLGTTNSGGIVLEYRSTPGGPTTTVTVPGLAAPYWIELNKSGTQYTAYISPTGTLNTWTQVGSTVDLGFGTATDNVGMAVSSHNNSALSTATFGDFTIVVGALPVKLISFAASNISNQYILVSWSTSSEKDSKYFEVQRSADGLAYNAIGQVAAAGTSSLIQYYTLRDNNPAHGSNFYRLRIVDKDGTFGYSKVATVLFGAGEIPEVYPNPASKSFTVTAGAEVIKEITVIDASGKTIEHIVNTNGSPTVIIGCDNFAGGVYIIRITTEANVYEQKLIKKKE
ncbi:MAG TPA: T9SS type A sorting domain-containing protein, partial [Puia sp.]|nr:T9SS type A sorting domain-containing protein [Puia sp.]